MLSIPPSDTRLLDRHHLAMVPYSSVAADSLRLLGFFPKLILPVGGEIMGGIYRECDIDPALMARAAEWLAGFHPDIAVTTEPRIVRLEAAGWSTVELESLWENALANERLFERAAPFRAAVLQTLVE